jgi:hypothetical protein
MPGLRTLPWKTWCSNGGSEFGWIRDAVSATRGRYRESANTLTLLHRSKRNQRTDYQF